MVIILSFAFPPPSSTMKFTCSFCNKVFATELDLSKHISACSVKTTCSVVLPSGTFTAYRNSNNQWPCYCDLSKCKNKIFSTDRALQQHIRRDAKPDTQWKVSFCLCNHLFLIYILSYRQVPQNLLISKLRHQPYPQVPWNLEISLVRYVLIVFQTD